MFLRHMPSGRLPRFTSLAALPISLQVSRHPRPAHYRISISPLSKFSCIAGIKTHENFERGWVFGIAPIWNCGEMGRLGAVHQIRKDVGGTQSGICTCLAVAARVSLRQDTLS